jgi:hypothetical protein
MARLFDVTLCGSGIFFDNYAEQDIIGFLNVRRVSADSREDAIRRARHETLIAWNYAHNISRKLGVPQLDVVRVDAAKRWQHRHPREEFFFFNSSQVKQEHLLTIVNSRRPWYRRAIKSL